MENQRDISWAVLRLLKAGHLDKVVFGADDGLLLAVIPREDVFQDTVKEHLDRARCQTWPQQLLRNGLIMDRLQNGDFSSTVNVPFLD